MQVKEPVKRWCYCNGSCLVVDFRWGFWNAVIPLANRGFSIDLQVRRSHPDLVKLQRYLDTLYQKADPITLLLSIKLWLFSHLWLSFFLASSIYQTCFSDISWIYQPGSPHPIPTNNHTISYLTLVFYYYLSSSSYFILRGILQLLSHQSCSWSTIFALHLSISASFLVYCRDISTQPTTAIAMKRVVFYSWLCCNW